MPECLVVVAHGTASPAGRATTEQLVAAVRAARPGVDVELCFLDVIAPRLPDTLVGLGGRPGVVVPLLLSTGYHVQSDIPAAVARHPHVRVARHLGPHPLLARALADRVSDLAGPANSLILAGAGSTRADAAIELQEAARLLAAHTGRPVTTATVGEGLRPALAAARGPVHVATYLLAEGRFAAMLRAAAVEVGSTSVAEPLGTHPALVDLVWQRYDEAARVV
jgi:sirohydrochlorin ferrochelatase